MKPLIYYPNQIKQVASGERCLVLYRSDNQTWKIDSLMAKIHCHNITDKLKEDGAFEIRAYSGVSEKCVKKISDDIESLNRGNTADCEFLKKYDSVENDLDMLLVDPKYLKT